jgi:hypothetical protein
MAKAGAKWPCIKCNENVAGKGKEGKGMQCSFCELYCHQHCAGISDELYKHLREQDSAGFHFWICSSCKSSSLVFKRQLDNLSKRLDKVESEASQNSADITGVKEDIRGVNKRVEGIEAAVKDKSDNVQDTVFTELTERESKKNNLILHNINEPGKDLRPAERKEADIGEVIKISEILTCKLEKKDIKFCSRIGEFNGEAMEPRPLLVGLRNDLNQKKMLEQAFNLAKSNYKHVSIVPDLTRLQRTQDYKVRREAETKNAAMNEEDSLNWMWRATGLRGHQYLVKVRRPQQQQQQQQKQQQLDRPGHSRTERNRRGSKRNLSQEEGLEELDQPPRKQ